MTPDLLFEDLPRRPNRKLMRVQDAGEGMVRFVCQHCGHDDGWSRVSTVTEAKRGVPCPKCNEEQSGD